ncbi:AraC family transcriptional regulator with amidase-like domain [Nocardia tenerifensis]|uniref:AraC family transcriptional regulator with amidase-like domain n=1 Tax=Nocardia tenerifensis TaxID=228006 RepID=A0A318JRV8_9NOCA|nr:DJ-1/PfpI family protein [Nocardia tenerifensis]PXX58715.1 AraC family transcriptional regulator with amidase-like domain [Nocardia tenerifensis]
MESTGEVVVAVSEGVLLLDVAGPAQVLHWAGRRVRFASPDGKDVCTDVGLPLAVSAAVGDLTGSIDTLLVPGYPPELPVPADLVEVVRVAGAGARRVASVCTGALVLAEAGLLDGRRATTHWLACDQLAQRFPRIEVDPDAICVRDGQVLTSAGVTAGIDLALALVEEDHGIESARSIAKHLVVFLRRPGGQAQFSQRARIGQPRNKSLRTAVESVTADLAADHSLAAMAERASLSERHLSRLFRQEMGVTPAQYVKQARVEAAQAMLETTDDLVAAIARHSGFGSEETMRRTFLEVLGTTPSDYRGRFRASAL